MLLTPRNSYCFTLRTANTAVSILTSPWHISYQFRAEIMLLLCMASVVLLTKIEPTGNSNNCIYYLFLTFRNKCLKVAKKQKLVFSFILKTSPTHASPHLHQQGPWEKAALLWFFCKIMLRQKKPALNFIFYSWPAMRFTFGLTETEI